MRATEARPACARLAVSYVVRRISRAPAPSTVAAALPCDCASRGSLRRGVLVPRTAVVAPRSPPPLPLHAAPAGAPAHGGSAQRAAMRGRSGGPSVLPSKAALRPGPLSAPRRAAPLLAASFSAFVLWSAVLSPRRYPPVVPGERVLHLPPGLPPPPRDGVVELVVSRFRDDLAWLPAVAALLNANVTVYCKESSAPPPEVPCDVSLANVGNEGHSYLHHMATRHGSLAPLTLFLPDTVWNDPTLSKPHFMHDVVTAVRRDEGRLAFADMHLPDTPPRALYGWVKELWQGYKLPCESSQHGGVACRWDGTSRANGAGGALTAASPSDFYEWMRVHAGATHADMRRCGWSFRGIFAAAAPLVRKHPPALYEHLRDELGTAVFPVAGMYMERLWRRVLLCAPPTPPGALLPWERPEAAALLGSRDA